MHMSNKFRDVRVLMCMCTIILNVIIIITHSTCYGGGFTKCSRITIVDHAIRSSIHICSSTAWIILPFGFAVSGSVLVSVSASFSAFGCSFVFQRSKEARAVYHIRYSLPKMFILIRNLPLPSSSLSGDVCLDLIFRMKCESSSLASPFAPAFSALAGNCSL